MSDKPSEWGKKVANRFDLSTDAVGVFADAIAEEGARRARVRHFPGADPGGDANLLQALSDVEELRRSGDELSEEIVTLRAQLAAARKEAVESARILAIGRKEIADLRDVLDAGEDETFGEAVNRLVTDLDSALSRESAALEKLAALEDECFLETAAGREWCQNVRTQIRLEESARSERLEADLRSEQSLRCDAEGAREIMREKLHGVEAEVAKLRKRLPVCEECMQDAETDRAMYERLAAENARLREVKRWADKAAERPYYWSGVTFEFVCPGCGVIPEPGQGDLVEHHIYETCWVPNLRAALAACEQTEPSKIFVTTLQGAIDQTVKAIEQAASEGTISQMNVPAYLQRWRLLSKNGAETCLVLAIGNDRVRVVYETDPRNEIDQTARDGPIVEMSLAEFLRSYSFVCDASGEAGGRLTVYSGSTYEVVDAKEWARRVALHAECAPAPEPAKAAEVTAPKSSWDGNPITDPPPAGDFLGPHGDRNELAKAAEATTPKFITPPPRPDNPVADPVAHLLQKLADEHARIATLEADNLRLSNALTGMAWHLGGEQLTEGLNQYARMIAAEAARCEQEILSAAPLPLATDAEIRAMAKEHVCPPPLATDAEVKAMAEALVNERRECEACLSSSTVRCEACTATWDHGFATAADVLKRCKP
jgi:hypothetical protein